MTLAWSGRISDIKKKGAPVEMVYNQGVLTGTSWVIPKGSKNKDIAMQFIAYASKPEVQAIHSSLINNPPANTSAYKFIDPAIAKELATAPEHLPKMVILDANWWLDNFDKDARFQGSDDG